MCQKSKLAEKIDGFISTMQNIGQKVNSNGLNAELQTKVDAAIRSISSVCKEIELAESNKRLLSGLKEQFRKATLPLFLQSYCIKRSYDKPRGYAGDFEIIDRIYKNTPVGQGIGLALDTYYLGNPGSVAMRSRKKYCVFRLLEELEALKQKNREIISVLDIGSGPGRDVLEIAENLRDKKHIKFTLFDQDEEALKHSEKILINYADIVDYRKLNLMRIVAGEKYNRQRYGEHDIIMCIGLYDYLEEKDAVRLTKAAFSMLKKNGLLVISNWDISNPSRTEMEWVCDWHVYHRTQNEMTGIANKAGIRDKNIEAVKDPTGHFDILFLRNN